MKGSPLMDEQDLQKPVSSSLAVTGEMKSLLERKVDKQDIIEMLNKKTSKMDSEMTLRQIDTLNQQLNSLVLLLNQHLKNQIEGNHAQKKENETNVMQQLKALKNWISKN